MELQNVEHAFGQSLMHKRLFGIHEHAHPHHMRWQRRRDGLSLLQCHVTRTVFIKHQPNRIRAGLGGSECIGFTSDAANLDGDAHLTIPAQSNFAAVLDAARNVALLEVLLGNLAIHAFRRLEGANRFAAFGEGLEFFVALRLAALAKPSRIRRSSRQVPG